MNQLDRTVASMMSKFGTTAYFNIVTKATYDTETSQNVTTSRKIPVKVLMFDFLRKEDGLGAERNTLVQSGDKQVFVQPPQKQPEGFALPKLNPTSDTFEINNISYKIVFIKEHNPSMTTDGCVFYELYVRV